ncbi:hypothetical protein [Bacillus wiedmannii]|uniref:hypothetical protein n=1 Tax=Bacillus wiedmannii TaxID=1890302 RepID=UPI000BEFFD39|nr:hypothetical protein [Bacillus wiedmannii]PEJ48389.1 hypothetical protein CN672_13675 [Bacillus wiedmannii]PEM10325.1 hypothetical protein CN610_14155 [Bacillus wiedmannii]PGD08222.1 hypothetical protein COM34_14055 [Bacillus wiedmannii]PHD09563.1 hypothetical protein COF45_17870 [Bacillus wiedmannii]
MNLSERLMIMENTRLKKENDELKKQVEEGEPYEVETEFNGMTIRMDYVRYRQFMRDMAAGVFNGNG